MKKSKVNFVWYRLKMVSKIMLYSLEDESAELELIGKVDKGRVEQYSALWLLLQKFNIIDWAFDL